jgi:prepilin signal peptidase PulO-like enzyme (type II secretory pathway)
MAVRGLAIVSAFVIQAAAAILLLAAGRTNHHASLAFGPALIGAALAALHI